MSSISCGEGFPFKYIDDNHCLNPLYVSSLLEASVLQYLLYWIMRNTTEYTYTIPIWPHDIDNLVLIDILCVELAGILLCLQGCKRLAWGWRPKI